MQYLGFGSLWLPVVLVTVATFVVSFICWMAFPWHKTEFKPLPNEAAVRKALTDQGVVSGQWRIPGMQTKEEWKSPETDALFKSGPTGIIQLRTPGSSNMGVYLLKSFVFFFVIAFLTAYVLRHAFLPGADRWLVARVACCTTFMAHALGHVQDAIWMGKSWRRVIYQAVDSLLYAAATAAIFAGMWPKG